MARAAITTVIGPNGAGKSTAFKAIFGLLPLRAGRILLDGEDVTGLSPRTLIAAACATSRRGATSFPNCPCARTSNSAAWRWAVPARCARGWRQALDRFPVLRQKARAQASTLSGGQQKLLEIARGLIGRPRLMLIDEPSIGLSPLMVQEVFATLQRLRDGGMSVLMVEQNARSALEISDHAIVLEGGRTRLVGAARDILADPRVARLFLGAEIELDEVP